MEQPGLSQGGGTGSIQGTRTKEAAPGDSRAWGQAAAPFPSPCVGITQSSWGWHPWVQQGAAVGTFQLQEWGTGQQGRDRGWPQLRGVRRLHTPPRDTSMEWVHWWPGASSGQDEQLAHFTVLQPRTAKSCWGQSRTPDDHRKSCCGSRPSALSLSPPAADPCGDRSP